MLGDLFLSSLAAVIIETAIFWLAGYRSRDEAIVVICTNVVTNLVLNLVLSGLFFSVTGYMMRISGLLVIAVETAIYKAAFGRFEKVLALTVAANLLSVFVWAFLFMGDGKELVSSDLSMFGFARDLL